MDKVKLFTLSLPYEIETQIKKFRNNHFKIEANPSFKILDSQLILGITSLKKIPKNLPIPESNYVVDFKTTYLDNILFLKSSKNLDFEKNLILTKEQTYSVNNIFPLNSIKIHTPLIYLANDINHYTLERKEQRLFNEKININDFKINLLEINIEDKTISCKYLDSLHLSKDK